LGITEPPKEEEKEEEKRDAFGFARAAEVGVRKAVKAAAPRPTVIPRMSSAKSVGGISVPSGASTVAAFRKLEIPKAKGKIYIPPPKSKSYVLSAGQKIERIAPGITSYRGTDKLIGDKWKLAEAGEKMDVGEAAKAAEATKEFLKSQPAGQPTGGKASFDGGISASPKIGGSFSPWIRPLDEELKLIHEKNKLALEKMAAEKALGLEYEWKKIPAVAAAAAAGEAAKAVGGELGGILAAPLSAFKDVVTEAFGITGGPTKWTCKIDAVSATSPIPPFPTPFGMTPGSPGSPFVPCKCMGSVAAKGPGDPPYDSLVTQCMGQRPPGKVGKLAECKKFCP
jgi:hypothetical protein